MSTSEANAGPARRDPSHAAVLLVIVLANLGLILAGLRLRSAHLAADTTEPTLNPSPKIFRRLNSGPILQNDRYLSWLFDAVRGKRGVLFLGTSESGPPHNLGAQLNAVDPQGPPMVVLQKMGLSPIHATLLFARCRREGIEPPPLAMVVNLVYFTRSHDVIDDGWLSSVMRAPVFVQMDHRDVREALSAGVLEAYDRHFRLRSALYPILQQEYFGDLLYLSGHQSASAPFARSSVPVEVHRFDGRIPVYDEARGVHAGTVVKDVLARNRWDVKSPESCLNLKGLASTMEALRDAPAPVLLLVLPVNLTFYSHYGVDPEDLRRRYGALRGPIGAFRRTGRVFVADMEDRPNLHFGFEDRMHNDAYGHYQLAKYLVGAPEYRSFVDAVSAYYNRSATQEPWRGRTFSP